MKKAIIYTIVITGLLFHSCRKSDLHLPGEEKKRGEWFEPSPYGMAYVQRGYYIMGPSDDEIWSDGTTSKQVTVEAFWMDDTEITNNEYRQFVYYVRDSIARRLLAETYADFVITESATGVPLKNPVLNWNEQIDWKDPDYKMAMDELFIPDEERFAGRREVDSRKLIYEYDWVDYNQAARRQNSYDFKNKRYNGSIINKDGEEIPIVNRSSFLMHEVVPVYPDTLCWIRDFAYTYNEPYTMKYFSHVGFDNYPVVGVTWKQAKAFCNWRTKLNSQYVSRFNDAPAHDYRLPSESEWEYAARGGRLNTIYPWGSYYTRNQKGCFLANFKPLRGNYVADSPTTTTAMKVGEFDPNPYGLYDMAGNVAEWTNSAFYEAAYDVVSDFNPELQYNAKTDDPPVMKRKVVRGGSWKDMKYFIRNSTRSYEYQDTAKSYIGFRCVRTSFRNDLQNR